MLDFIVITFVGIVLIGGLLLILKSELEPTELEKRS